MNIFKVMQIILLVSISTTASSTFATPINYALNGTATADNSWNGHVPNNTIDGNNSSYWNSGHFPSAWIEIDLGAEQEIAEINAFVGQLPAGNTVHNIYLDSTLSHTWNQFTDAGDILTWVLPTKINAQLIKIETVSSPSWVSWGEISVLSEVSAVPVPAAAWLFGSGLIGLIGIKRKHKTLLNNT